MAESTTSHVPGDSGILGSRTVARISYGAMQLQRPHDDPQSAVSLVRHLLERGVNHVDTAQFYGNGFANDILRRAVDDENVVVATKIGADVETNGPIPLRPAQRPEELRASVEDNLRSLGRERLDLIYLRRYDSGPGLQLSGDQVVPLDDQLAAMTKLREEGKIAAIGLSGITLDVLQAAVAAGIVAVQNSYSLLNREGEDILRLCEGEGIAWVPFFPLGSAFPNNPKVADNPDVRRIASDLDVTPAQIGLAWLLQHSPHTLLIPGTTSMAHLDENLAAGDIAIPAASVAVLDAIA